jgi:hypothetical protein
LIAESDKVEVGPPQHRPNGLPPDHCTVNLLYGS